MSNSVISLGLGLGGGKSATSSGRAAGGGGGFPNEFSVAFDGVNDFMAVSPSSSIQMYGLSMWFQPDSAISKSSSSQVAFGPAGTYWLPGFGNIAGLLTNELISIFIGAVYGYTSSSATISTNWHHLAIAWSTSAATTGGDGYDIWLDGVKVGNASNNALGSFSLYTIPASAIAFGSRPNNSFHFDGKLDEVALFSSLLSASDIATLYNSGVPGDISSLNPVGWWRMGDNNSGSGTTITDQGSGGNNGTLTNGPTFSSSVPS